MKSDLKETEKNKFVIRLERNQNDLLQLKLKLSSYICEPRTPSLFECMEKLKSQLQSLTDSSNQMIDAIKVDKKSAEDFVVRSQLTHKEFSQLREGVEEHVATARNC